MSSPTLIAIAIAIDVLFTFYVIVVYIALWRSVISKLREGKAVDIKKDEAELNFLFKKYKVSIPTLVILAIAAIPLEVLTSIFSLSVFTGVPMSELLYGLLKSMIGAENAKP